MHGTGVIMKYVKEKNFHEITAMNNYEGLGQENFQALERGENVDIKEPSKAVKGGFIQPTKSEAK